MRIKDQKGFSPIYFLLALLVIGIIGFASWKVLDANREKSNSSVQQDKVSDSESNSTSSNSSDQAKTATKKPEDPTKDWTTFKDESTKLSFKYPKDWKITKHDTSIYGPGMIYNEITNPSGNVVLLYANFTQIGGGSCEVSGSLCPSVDTLVFDDFSTISGTSLKYVEKIADLTSSKKGFTPSFGLYSYKQDSPKINLGTKVGDDYYLVFNLPNYDNSIVFSMESKSVSSNDSLFKTKQEAKDFLASDDVKIAKQVIKSLKTY